MNNYVEENEVEEVESVWSSIQEIPFTIRWEEGDYPSNDNSNWVANCDYGHNISPIINYPSTGKQIRVVMTIDKSHISFGKYKKAGIKLFLTKTDDMMN